MRPNVRFALVATNLTSLCVDAFVEVPAHAQTLIIT